MKMKKLNIWMLLSAALLIAACNPTKPTQDTSSEPEIIENTSSGSSTTDGMGDSSIRSGGFDGDARDLDTADSLIIYFAYDRSEVDPKYADLLAAHARRLASDPSMQLRLQGHADERGSREYNIGLGERRAQAVRRLLLIQGASSRQLSTVSYGEERPAAFGSTESDYEKNRRVELAYRR